MTILGQNVQEQNVKGGGGGGGGRSGRKRPAAKRPGAKLKGMEWFWGETSRNHLYLFASKYLKIYIQSSKSGFISM